MMTKPVLYHCPQTRAGATSWMNEEVGAPCDVRLVNLRAGAHKADAYMAINPMGKVPTLTDGPVTITETAAICAYLADRYPDAGLAPATNNPLRGTYYRWMFFAPSCIEPMMQDKLGGTKRTNDGAVAYGSEDAVLRALHAALDGKTYLVGEQFTAADVVLGSTLNFAMMFGAIEKVEPFTSYADRLMNRPAAARARAKDEAFLKQMDADKA